MRTSYKLLIGLFGTIAAMMLVSFDTYQLRAEPKAGDVLVEFTPVPLHTENPSLSRVGALDYLGGFVLTSDNDAFGGYSSLHVTEDGKLLALSDAGWWLWGDMPALGDKAHSQTMQTRLIAGQDHDVLKIGTDAEALTKLADGYMVAFEQEHRAVKVAGPLVPEQAGQKGEELPVSDKMRSWGMSRNKGIEALTGIGDGKFLMFAETGRNPQGYLPAWIYDSGADTAKPLKFDPPRNFSPTAAETLPNGDVLVLMRHFSTAEGVKMKMIRIDRAFLNGGNIAAGTVIKGEELIELTPPYTVDNMEGLSVVPKADGSIIIHIISDDNFNAVQRTLLMSFRLLVSAQ